LDIGGDVEAVVGGEGERGKKGLITSGIRVRNVDITVALDCGHLFVVDGNDEGAAAFVSISICDGVSLGGVALLEDAIVGGLGGGGDVDLEAVVSAKGSGVSDMGITSIKVGLSDDVRRAKNSGLFSIFHCDLEGAVLGVSSLVCGPVTDSGFSLVVDFVAWSVDLDDADTRTVISGRRIIDVEIGSAHVVVSVGELVRRTTDDVGVSSVENRNDKIASGLVARLVSDLEGDFGVSSGKVLA
jgi:hypothetical protein